MLLRPATDLDILKHIYTKYIQNVPMIRFLMLPTFFCMFIARYLEVKSGEMMQHVSLVLSKTPMNEYGNLISKFFIVSILSCLLVELQGYIFTGPIQRAFRVASKEAFKDYFLLEYSKFHQIGLGEITATIDRKSRAISEILDVLVLNFLPVIFVILYSSWKIYSIIGFLPMLILNVSLLIYGVITIQLAKWRNAIRVDLNKSINKSSNMLYDSLANYDSILTYNNEKLELMRFDTTLRDVEYYSVKLWKSFYLLNFLQKLAFAFQSCAIIYFGLYGIFMKRMSADEFILYISIGRILASNLDKLGYMVSRYTQAMTNAKTAHKFIEDLDLPEKNHYSIREFNNSIEFKNVGFSYGYHSIFENISFKIRKGEKVAIIGNNGVGKSTLIKMLLGFNDYRGEITIDGDDIKYLSKESLRNIISYVPQDTGLFNETVKYNIKYGSLECPDSVIIDRCKRLNVHDSILKLENGYSTIVGSKGNNLSGGERQKISLMRAILKDSDILLLDEPTANLDKEAESNVIELFLKHYKERTLMMIVHNLNLLRYFDKILLLSEGTVREVKMDDNLDFLKNIRR